VVRARERWRDGFEEERREKRERERTLPMVEVGARRGILSVY
jgi:hypothetical protein